MLDKIKIMHKIADVTLPITTVSEANMTGEHWSKKHRRHKLQQGQIKMAWLTTSLRDASLPCHVVLTRLSPRLIDQHDNLPAAFKYITDAIAKQITGIATAGRGDNVAGLTFEFKQLKDKQKAIRIEIFNHEKN